MKKSLYVLALFMMIVGLGLTGCQPKATTTDMAGTASGTDAAAPGGDRGGITEASLGDTAALAATAESIKDVYFDYDQFTVRGDARGVLKTNADILSSDMASTITIEGHCDDRGSGEYNIALGQRRAESVQKYLVNLGVSPGRINIVSFGKEKPFCNDSNEACWQSNRRAHFVVR